MIDDKGTAACRFLAWDSIFFGKRIARLLPRRLNPPKIKEALNWCRNQKINCLYFLADADDFPTIRFAEDQGFRLVDVRVTFERKLDFLDKPEPPEGVKFRLSRKADIPRLEAIAKTAHRDSRFYADAKFPKAACDELYRTWIRKSCGSYADAVWVAEQRGAAIGYTACHLREERQGEIGLVGISRESRGTGVGQRLIFEALRWLSQHGMRHARVVTQGRNARAQRLYQRSGFVTRSVELSYHLWPDNQNQAIRAI